MPQSARTNDCCAKRSLLSAEETPWLWAAVLNFGDMVCFKLIEISGGNRSMDLEFGRRFQLIQPFCLCNFGTHTAILAKWFCFGTLVNAVAFLSAFRIAGSCVNVAAVNRSCQAVLLLLKNGQVVIKKCWLMLCQHTFFNPSQSYPPLHSKSEQSSTSAPSCHKCFPHRMKPYETMVVVDVLIESVEQMQVMLMQKNHGEDRRSPLPQGGPRCSALVSGACEKCWNAMAKDEILERSLRSQIYKNTNEINIIDIQIYRSSKWTRIVCQDASPQCSGTAHGCWRWDAQALPAVAGTAYSRRSPQVQPCDCWIFDL